MPTYDMFGSVEVEIRLSKKGSIQYKSTSSGRWRNVDLWNFDQEEIDEMATILYSGIFDEILEDL